MPTHSISRSTARTGGVSGNISSRSETEVHKPRFFMSSSPGLAWPEPAEQSIKFNLNRPWAALGNRKALRNLTQCPLQMQDILILLQIDMIVVFDVRYEPQHRQSND